MAGVVTQDSDLVKTAIPNYLNYRGNVIRAGWCRFPEAAFQGFLEDLAKVVHPDAEIILVFHSPA